MRSHLIPINTLFLVILCFSLSSIRSPWLFLSLLVGFSFLLSFFFSTWLVAGGFAWRRFCGNTKTAPGPIGWPILGCLPIMGPLAHRKLAGLAETHDARRLMAVSLGATPVIVSSRPDTAREILHGPAFCDRPVKAAARGLMFERAIGFAPAGDHWRHLRHIAATNMFSPRKVAALEGLRRRAADSMVGRVWREMEEREKVVVREVLQEGSLETMVKSVFGESLGEEDRVELVKMVKEGYELIGKFNLEDYFPLMGGLLDFYGVGRRCNKLGDRVRALVGKIVEERRVKGDYNMQHDFLSLMLTLPKEESLRDSDIIAVLWEMIFRGADVVAVLLEWIMARLVLHPNIQARIQAELDSVIGTRPVSDAEIPKLRYLQAVVKETLRMHPPGPLLSWARLAVCDAHVDKFFVPAGTTAMVNMWAITHDGSIWKDPWAFRPERFLEEDVSIMGSDLRLAPFGSGRRVCPGRVLGLTTVHLWLARLAQEYIWSAGRPVQLSERLQLSMEMKRPLVCRVVRRSRTSCEVGHDEM
ncbi:cytochrome P450 78A5-like [Ananas comosus]|uniref:Cytochrome P450 78A5-like n=1 Tax=Ananas comosus TaxID=4615 RepID=A0A6P5GK08_ANACO|nr:cytochrome P450 78A5-like [Ananas comosus]